MKLFYFWSSDQTRKPIPGERNEGIESVPALLNQLTAKGVDVEFVDTANFSDKTHAEAYTRAVIPAVYRHYEVKRMLGTNRRSGCFFGAEVPALLVTRVNSAGDTYPHRKGNQIVTIHGFLIRLLAEMGREH